MKAKYLWTAVFVLALGLSVWAAAQVTDKAVDPVCGTSIAMEGAKWTFDYKGTTYYFCSEACKTGFAKDPEKFLAMMAAAAPHAQMPARQGCCCCCCMRMAGGKGMMAQPMPPMQGHMHMKPEMMQGMMGPGQMGFGLMNIEDLEKKIETTKDGVIIILSSKNPETVKKIQEHIAKMAEHEAKMMKQGCGMKKEIKVEIKEVKEDKK